MMTQMKLNLVRLNKSELVIEKETITIEYDEFRNDFEKVRSELLELGQLRLRQKTGNWFMRLTKE